MRTNVNISRTQIIRDQKLLHQAAVKLTENTPERERESEKLTSMLRVGRTSDEQTDPLLPAPEENISSRERALQEEVENLRWEVEMMRLQVGVELNSETSPPTYQE